MKRLLYSIPGCVILLSAAFATPIPLDAAEKTVKAKPATIYTQSEFKISQERMAMIDALLDRTIKRGLDVSKQSTILLLETEISGKMPLVPKAPVSNKTISQISAEARKIVRDDVAYTAQQANLRVAAEKEAAEKYPIAKLRTKVKFQYQKGPYIQDVEGIFFAATERYVQINDKRIPYVDLTDELRAKFDRKFNAEIRKEYVEKKIRELDQKKNDEIQQTFTKLLAGQDNLNEKNGYIYDKSAKQWTTARGYLQKQLPDAMKKYQAYLEEQRIKQQKARELEAARAKELAASRAVTAIDTSDVKKYEEILNAAKEKRQEIRENKSGVDTYQGFRNALWGASRYDVAYLFSRTKGARYEYVDFNSKLILPRYFPAEVFFVFDNNSLVKVVIDYGYQPRQKDDEAAKSDVKRLFSSEDFNNLVISLHDICGESDEEKAAKGNIFKEIANGTLTPEKLHPPQPQDNQEDEKAAPVIVKDFTVTWTGKETDMTLSFRYDKDNDVYQNVQLTKELKK